MRIRILRKLNPYMTLAHAVYTIYDGKGKSSRITMYLEANDSVEDLTGAVDTTLSLIKPLVTGAITSCNLIIPVQTVFTTYHSKSDASAISDVEETARIIIATLQQGKPYYTLNIPTFTEALVEPSGRIPDDSDAVGALFNFYRDLSDPFPNPDTGVSSLKTNYRGDVLFGVAKAYQYFSPKKYK